MSKYKGLIIRGENGALTRDEKAHMRMEIGHLLTEKRQPSDFDRGIYEKGIGSS